MVAQAADDGEELLDLVGVEAGGRLVEDEDLALGDHGPADRDELLEGQRQRRQRLLRVEVAEAELREVAAAARLVARQLMPAGPRTSWPSMTFSPMVRFAQRLTSW
nr:hypothetical protein GCM10025732_32860 [Glycomyces mayteni]